MSRPKRCQEFTLPSAILMVNGPTTPKRPSSSGDSDVKSVVSDAAPVRLGVGIMVTPFQVRKIEPVWPEVEP